MANPRIYPIPPDTLLNIPDTLLNIPDMHLNFPVMLLNPQECRCTVEGAVRVHRKCLSSLVVWQLNLLERLMQSNLQHFANGLCNYTLSIPVPAISRDLTC